MIQYVPGKEKIKPGMPVKNPIFLHRIPGFSLYMYFPFKCFYAFSGLFAPFVTVFPLFSEPFPASPGPFPPWSGEAFPAAFQAPKGGDSSGSPVSRPASYQA